MRSRRRVDASFALSYIQNNCQKVNHSMDEKKPKKRRPGMYGGRAATGRIRYPKPGSFHIRLEVELMTGPFSAKYADTVMTRTIEIHDSLSLMDLHDVILEAFNREDASTWAFLIGGKGLYDKKNIMYGPIETGQFHDSEATKMADLRLKVGDAFGYLFDFGRRWEHSIHVRQIEPTDKATTKPRVVKKIGKSPPQYPAM